MHEKKTRNSNLELLRLASMLMIVAFHGRRVGCADGAWSLSVYVTKCAIGEWGLLGVDCFVILSAWFMTEQSFRSRRIVSILVQTVSVMVFFYGLVFVNALAAGQSFSAAMTAMVECVLGGLEDPLWTKTYWFVTAYLFLMLLSPVLNSLIGSCRQEKLKSLLFLLSFIPVLSQFMTSPVTDIASFAWVYLLVGYIRRWGWPALTERATPWSFLLLSLLIFFSDLALFRKPENGFLRFLYALVKNTTGATGRHSVIILLDALLLFFWVVRLPETNWNAINRVASHTLGVYLIHENNIGFNPTDRLMKAAKGCGFLTPGILFPFRYAALCVGIMAACLLLEWLREVLIQKPLMKGVEKRHGQKLNGADDWMNSRWTM